MNTGVPVGTRLTASGSLVVTVPGTVVSRLDVHGSIRIQANDVTVKDTRITNSSPDGAAVFIAPKVAGTRIEDSTISGQDAGAQAIEYAILNSGWGPNASTRATRVQLYDCTECYSGPGTIRDSYVNASASTEGVHYEDIYYGGGAGPLTVKHNTLLNPHRQTAVIFTKPDYGRVSHTTIDSNLLAGGGWTIYGGSDSARAVTVTRNRFSSAYYQKIGYFGVATAFNWHSTTWVGNYADATLRPVHG